MLHFRYLQYKYVYSINIDTAFLDNGKMDVVFSIFLLGTYVR